MFNLFRFQSLASGRRNLVTSVPWIQNVFGSLYEVINENFRFLKIHGPTVDEVTKDLDLSNKTCLITGTTSGIGLEMTRCLSSRGCNVLMACRNRYAAAVVTKSVCENHHLLRAYDINLASLKSVKKCSEDIVRNHSKVDMVILNAGVFGVPWILTEDGFETTFQVNYLSQFYLLMNIENILAPDARVVFVSSESHRHIKWDMQDILAPYEEMLSLPKEDFTSIRAYNVSKLCGLLAMHYLEYRWRGNGRTVFAAHPGSFIRTGLARNWWLYEALYLFMKPFSKSISQAASTPVYCATSPELNGISDIYVKDCKHCEESDLAKDSHLSFRIMDLTNDMLQDSVALHNVAVKENKTMDEQIGNIEEETKEPTEDVVFNKSV